MNDDLIYRGIILKQNNYGEAHRILTILTRDDGIVKAVRYGVRGKKASNAAAFQVMCYGDFKLRPSRGELMTAVSADIIDGFYPVSEDILKLSLLTYLADITYTLLGENNPDSRVLSLFLNTVYAASYRDENIMKIKSVYELKLMCAAGFMPYLGAVCECGRNAECFSPARGTIVCASCRKKGDIALHSTVLSMMRYIVGCEDKKMMSFSVNDEKLYDELSSVTEKYVSVQCEREFDSLAYFKAMRGLY